MDAFDHLVSSSSIMMQNKVQRSLIEIKNKNFCKEFDEVFHSFDHPS